jgi:putative hydrolase
MYLLANEEQRRLIGQIQALMAVVEGHGNYVMDTVGDQVIPSVGRMRAVFDRRREQTNIIQRAVGHAIGLEMKMRQYELGQRFCDAVVATQGSGALARLWRDPDHFPSLDELREPSLWLARVAA